MVKTVTVAHDKKLFNFNGFNNNKGINLSDLSDTPPPNCDLILDFLWFVILKSQKIWSKKIGMRLITLLKKCIISVLLSSCSSFFSFFLFLSLSLSLSLGQFIMVNRYKYLHIKIKSTFNHYDIIMRNLGLKITRHIKQNIKSHFRGRVSPFTYFREVL